MRMTRTYPTPDSNRESVGPRERAMAVYKYLLDVEPENAVRDPQFALIVHAFEQENRRGQRTAMMRFDGAVERLPAWGRSVFRRLFPKLDPAFDMPTLAPSLVEGELTKTFDQGPATVRPFKSMRGPE
jgi:hypothetical protein